MLGVSRPPINTLDLIRQNNAVVRNHDLEWIAFCLRCHRATQHQTGLVIVTGGTENDGRTMTGLFVASLLAELQPNDVTFRRHIVRH